MDSSVAACLGQLTPYPAVQAVWLFGSHARGTARIGSDIDLAVLCPAMTEDEWTRLWLHMHYEPPVLCRVDLVRLDQAPRALRTEIVSSGKIIYTAGNVDHAFLETTQGADAS